MGKIFTVDEGGLPLIPEGEYKAVFTKYEEKKALAYGDALRIDFEIKEGDFNGTVLNTLVSERLSPKSRFGKLVSALTGQPLKAKDGVDLDELLGKPCSIVVGTTEGKAGKGEKIPLVPWKELQTRRATRKEIINWFTSYPEANVGIVLGKVSNLMVVDIDPRNGGSYEEFKDVKTVKVKTGGGGWHIYFQYDEGFHNLSSIRSGIDIKTEKGYAVAPPSIHQSGDLYKWISNPFDTQIIPIPDSIKEWLLNGKQEIKQNDKSTKIEEIVRGVCAGQRNTSAASLTGKLLRSLEEKEWESIAWPLIKSWNKENNNPPSPEEELRTTFESIKKKEWQRVEEEEQKGSFTKQLIEKILSSGAILFKDEYGDGYISPDGTGREIMKLRSRSFKLLVSRCSWQNFDGQPVHTDVISNITQMLEAKDLFEGEQSNLFVGIEGLVEE